MITWIKKSLIIYPCQVISAVPVSPRMLRGRNKLPLQSLTRAPHRTPLYPTATHPSPPRTRPPRSVTVCAERAPHDLCLFRFISEPTDLIETLSAPCGSVPYCRDPSRPRTDPTSHNVCAPPPLPAAPRPGCHCCDGSCRMEAERGAQTLHVVPGRHALCIRTQ